MVLIAGLGNPGLRYRKTRHNAGFEVIDIISKKYGIPVRKKERQSLYGTGVIDGKKVTLIKPLTYMNKSGESIAGWVRYYDCDIPAEVVVISDDTALRPGSIRIRKKGSAGGHNGLKSIISALGTQEFHRVRIGVGEAEPGDDMITHVLGRMNRLDRIAAEGAFENAAAACALIAQGQTDKAMNLYN